MIDSHSNPTVAYQRRISVYRQQHALPSQEKPGLGVLPVGRYPSVPGPGCRPVGIEPIVSDLLEPRVGDVDDEPCDVFLLEILPSCLEYVDDPVLASFPSGLRAVVEKPDQVCEGVASCMAGNVKTVAEKHFLVIGVLLEVRMRIIFLFQ